MKYPLAVIFAALLTACAETGPGVERANLTQPYSRYATTHVVTGPTGTVYAKWSTRDLQQRRLELYATVPQRPITTANIPAYTFRGLPLPQQDEIKAIEAELNQRSKAGDKSAELRDAWPQGRRTSG